ncbi:hypothetical protein OL229_07380 [Neisseriaceae bacterium JH1-16]|nr:hypothetical protein [Neisseriaceae bacterium JH1-16]
MRRLTVLLLSLPFWLAAPAWSTTLKVCYHYGCQRQASFEVDEQAESTLAALFAASHDDVGERSAVVQAVQQLYQVAATQFAPIAEDRGGNFSDGTAEGKMDCVDHSTNVQGFLDYFLAHGWLRYHQLMGRTWRAPRVLDLHYAAQLHDIVDGSDWIVDSWFKDFGAPPLMVPLAIWMEGYSP